MCLYSNNAVQSIAEKDIECYKVLQIKTKKDGTKGYYGVIFENFEYNINGINTENELLNSVNDEYEVQLYKGNTVFVGHEVSKGLHSYQTEEDAVTLMLSVVSMNLALAKCVIPKGARYYFGKQGTIEHQGYCSDSLIIKEIKNERIV
jgi:hypothetical protein